MSLSSYSKVGFEWHKKIQFLIPKYYFNLAAVDAVYLFQKMDWRFGMLVLLDMHILKNKILH